MKSNLFLFFLFILFLFSTATSCERSQFLLDIEFGLTEEAMKDQLVKLLKNNELQIDTKNNNTQYYRKLRINGSTYNCKVYFNDDQLKSGPLRTYTYSLTTLPFVDSGNDTISKEGYIVNLFEVFKKTDFEKLKSYLDEKYGNGIISSEPDASENLYSYKYVTDKADLFFVHNELNKDSFFDIPLKVPFYTIAYIEIRSKTYSSAFKKEYEKRKKELAPEEIVRIGFDAPYLQNYYDKNGVQKTKIVTKAVSEFYSTYVIDEDILECKGILSIKDAYGDILKQGEIIYNFDPPLASPRKQQWRVMDYNAFEFYWTDPAFEKISRMIESGSILKVQFKATAVVLNDGSVIKQ